MNGSCVVKQCGIPEQAESACVRSFRLVTAEGEALSSDRLEYLIPPHICFPQFISNYNGINIYNSKQKSELKCFPKTLCPKDAALSLSISVSVFSKLIAKLSF